MMYKIAVLDSTHRREEFSCGNEILDNYLKKQASQDVKRQLSACFVMVDEQNNVKGYYTLSSASIPRENLPLSIAKKLPRNYENPPATLLGRLAIDKSLAGQGAGGSFLAKALERSFHQSKIIGSMAVIVDPIDENATKFYGKFGFLQLDSGKMFLEMKQIAKLVESNK
ncbi:MAG: GNAT family N-acetyltransferase [Flexibacter sp. CG_4_10_14_3_um_filter_32_15]|nr:MAG: GNAT family N-acetyltransferase [Flexibacter sp. CG_4_10_14_3_um_filter_32_15]